MKRIAVIVLLCFLLSGCSIPEGNHQEPVVFYYLKTEFTYDGTGSAIATEEREASGVRRDLPYMMALYLMGPSEEEHAMPLPFGTRIVPTVQENGSVLLQLSEAANALSDLEFSLACACLTLTCFDICDCQEVVVTCGERSISLNRSSLTLTDDITEYPVVEETQ